MKFVSGIIGLFFFSAACHAPQPKPATLFETIAAQQPGSTHYFVFAVNPNDCVNCLVGFRHFAETLDRLPQKEAACTVIFPAVRAVERPGILQSTLNEMDTTRFRVRWNDAEYQQVLGQCTKLSASSLCAFDAGGKIFFKSTVHNMTGLEKELAPFMRLTSSNSSAQSNYTSSR